MVPSKSTMRTELTTTAGAVPLGENLLKDEAIEEVLIGVAQAAAPSTASRSPSPALRAVEEPRWSVWSGFLFRGAHRLRQCASLQIGLEILAGVGTRDFRHVFRRVHA